MESDFSNRPIPKIKKTSWLNHLKPVKEWFPEARVEAYEVARKALGSSRAMEQLADELRREGFSLNDHMEFADWLKSVSNEDRKIVLVYETLLWNILWPPEVSRAIWGPREDLTPDDADAMIRFLEICPFFFRSGYAKDRATRRLRQCPLAADHPRRISGILRDRVELGVSRNMGGWLRLVKRSDFDETLKVAKEGLRSHNAVSRIRAILIVDRMVQEKMFGERKVKAADIIAELKKQES